MLLVQHIIFSSSSIMYYCKYCLNVSTIGTVVQLKYFVYFCELL